jgi:hypothetical protein
MTDCTHLDLHAVQLLPFPVFRCIKCSKKVRKPSRWVHYGENTSLERTINGYTVSNFEKLMLDGFKETLDAKERARKIINQKDNG